MEFLKTLVEKYLLWVIVVILLTNLYQKRNADRAIKKRMATLYLAVLVFIFNVLAVLILQFKLPFYSIFIALAIVIGLGVYFRKKIFIFSFRCKVCHERLNMNEFFLNDSNECSKCLSTKVEDIDWDNWEITDDCTILYVLDDKNQVLLIKSKKDGFSKDIISGPGGHIENGESPEEAAIRECYEETNIKVNDIQPMGVLLFHFLDGMKMRGYVYIARSFTGEIKESDEAIPFWNSLDNLPLDQMWSDCPYWIESVLKEGKSVNAKFVFSNTLVLDHKIELC